MSTTPNLLELSVQRFTANEVAINVKNKTSAALEKTLRIKLTLPDDLVAAAIASAAEAAADKVVDPPGMANVTTLMTGPPEWSVWAMGDTSESVVVLMFFNSRDQNWNRLTPPIKLEAGADFTILIPLKSHTGSAGLAIPYSYQHGTDADGPPVSGTLELRPPDPTEPTVTLTSNQLSPTMIKPGKKVEISWVVENAVSVTLRGPLPGGNTEWVLSNNPDSKISMHKGVFEITAVAPMSYILQAEVSRVGKPNLQVIRMLSLDVDTSAKYGYVATRWPRRVLPYGLVEVDWAAWGVKSVILETTGASRRVPLTDMSVTGFLQGVGVMRITAGKTSEEKSVPVAINVEQGEFSQVPPTSYTVIPWMELTTNFQGRAIALAVAAPNMALLTTDGLWIGEVEEHDTFTPLEELEFIKMATDKPKAWLALAALGQQFVVLRQTNQDDLQVKVYSFDGLSSAIPALDLPGVRPLMTSGAVFDLAVYGDRAYVVVEDPTQGVRSAFSVGFANDKAEHRREPLLEGFLNFRLLTFDDALYALNRDSGEMLRFELEDGKLQAYRAASAVDEKGASMVKQGLLVPVGHVLAVLTPTSVPSLESLKAFGLRNILPYKNLSPPRSGTVPQDLVYSPQNNRWSRCGHGLNVKEGAVAFRGGESPRLWLIDPAAKTYTLHVQSEYLFSQDYVEGLPAKPLPKVFNKKRPLMFINNTGMEFVPMSEACLKAGLRPFSAIGRAHLTSPIPTGKTNPKTAEPVDLWYNDAERPTAILRLLAKRAPGVKHDYVLEVTLFGPAFSWGKTVFKRVALDDRGNVTSIAVVPDKEDFPPNLGLIEVFPKQLTNGIRLRIRNTTPYTLWLLSPDAIDPADQLKKNDPEAGIRIRYNTPPFSIYAHGVGELPVDVDFSLPQGIEMSPASEAQKRRIRIRHNGPLALEIDSVNEARDYDDYECTLNYQQQERLTGAYLGDGVPSKDGTSIYVPIAEPPNATNAKILKIDANNLQTTARVSVAGRSMFTCPNSVAALEHVVVAIFNREQFHVLDHSLKPDPGFFPKMSDFEFTVITHLKGPAGNTIYLMGMKEEPTWQINHSYKYYRWSLSPVRPEEKGILDFLKSYRPGRIPGAPPWVAPNIITPMDVRLGAALALCVEGGVSGYDLKNNHNEIAVELPGTGREEAILVDPTEHVIFSAHSKASGSGLMISRINVANPREKLTIELPGGVMPMVSDPRPPTLPNFDYHRARAVSLLATPDALFVSHGYRIYVLDKTRLTQRQSVRLRFASRLIQVRRGKAPGENHPTYGVPQDCYYVWTLGARYLGDGQIVKGSGQDFDTILYKLAIGVGT